jgi:hypothetical protein
MRRQAEDDDSALEVQELDDPTRTDRASQPVDRPATREGFTNPPHPAPRAFATTNGNLHESLNMDHSSGNTKQTEDAAVRPRSSAKEIPLDLDPDALAEQSEDILTSLENEEDGFFDEVALERITNAQAMHGKLTHQELRNIERCFNEFDEDGSGTIDIDELNKVMLAMGHALTPQQLRELLHQVDVNNTGDIEFTEFVQLITLWKESSQFKLFDQAETTIQSQRIDNAMKTQFLLPDSTWHLAWDVLDAFTIVYFWVTTLLILTLDDAVAGKALEYLLATDIIFVIVSVISIGVNFLTVCPIRLPSGKIKCIDSFEGIAQHYASSWLLFDILICIPFNQMGNSLTFRILALLRLLKAVKLFFGENMFKQSGRKHMTPNYVWFFYSLLPLVKLLLAFIMLIQLLSFIWTLVKSASLQGPYIFINGTNATYAPGPTTAVVSLNETSLSQKAKDDGGDFVTSVYFIMQTITTNGYGDVVVETPGEKVLASIFCILAALINGLAIGYVVSQMQKTDIKTERESKLRETLAVCEYFHIPLALQDEILRFQNHVLEHNLSQAYTDLVGGLPQDMQMNINLYVRIRLVSYVPYFSNAHEGTKVALAQELVSEIYRPEEYIVYANDEGNGMFFISYGFVDVISVSGHLITTLKQGGYFGEMALLSANNRRTASVKALCYCDLFKLARLAFLAILKRFPKFRQEIIAVAEARRRELREIPSSPGNFSSSTFAGASPAPQRQTSGVVTSFTAESTSTTQPATPLDPLNVSATPTQRSEAPMEQSMKPEDHFNMAAVTSQLPVNVESLVYQCLKQLHELHGNLNELRVADGFEEDEVARVMHRQPSARRTPSKKGFDKTGGSDEIDSNQKLEAVNALWGSVRISPEPVVAGATSASSVVGPPALNRRAVSFQREKTADAAPAPLTEAKPQSAVELQQPLSGLSNDEQGLSKSHSDIGSERIGKNHAHQPQSIGRETRPRDDPQLGIGVRTVDEEEDDNTEVVPFDPNDVN